MESPNLQTKNFILGLDFDGIIADRNAVKSYGAFALFGARIEAGYFTREYATRGTNQWLAQGVPLTVINIEFNKLTMTQYNELQNDILSSGALVEHCPPVPGALEGIAKLREVCDDNGVHLTLPCITARAPATTIMARELLERYELAEAVTITSVQVTGRSKEAEAAHQGCDAFVDDNLRHIKGLGNYGIRAFLLDYPHNRGEDAEQYGIERVADWGELTKRVISMMGCVTEDRTSKAPLRTRRQASQRG